MGLHILHSILQQKIHISLSTRKRPNQPLTGRPACVCCVLVGYTCVGVGIVFGRSSSHLVVLVSVGGVRVTTAVRHDVKVQINTDATLLAVSHVLTSLVSSVEVAKLQSGTKVLELVHTRTGSMLAPLVRPELVVGVLALAGWPVLLEVVSDGCDVSRIELLASAVCVPLGPESVESHSMAHLAVLHSKHPVVALDPSDWFVGGAVERLGLGLARQQTNADDQKGCDNDSHGVIGLHKDRQGIKMMSEVVRKKCTTSLFHMKYIPCFGTHYSTCF